MKKTLENSLQRPRISWTKKGGNPEERRRGAGGGRKQEGKEKRAREGRSVPLPVHPTFTVYKRYMQELAAKTLYHNRGGGQGVRLSILPPLFSFLPPLFSFLPPRFTFHPSPLFSFLPVSLHTVRPLITDAQTGQKKTMYKYIPQLRT